MQFNIKFKTNIFNSSLTCACGSYPWFCSPTLIIISFQNVESYMYIVYVSGMDFGQTLHKYFLGYCVMQAISGWHWPTFWVFLKVTWFLLCFHLNFTWLLHLLFKVTDDRTATYCEYRTIPCVNTPWVWLKHNCLVFCGVALGKSLRLINTNYSVQKLVVNYLICCRNFRL